MSLEVWLRKGQKVNVGGRDLIMMPLPLPRLFKALYWLEDNSNGVISETVKTAEPGKLPNPLVLITRILGKVDMNQLAFDIFSYPKDPETGEPVNKGITKEWFDEYFDIPTAHDAVLKFVELNEIPEIIKNLQSLPVIKKLMEAASLTFGIPYLNSLQQSTDSAQMTSEGSPSPKSTDMSGQATLEKQEPGSQERTTLIQ